MSNSKSLLLLQNLSKYLLKSAFRSLKWNFLTLIWNLVLDFLILNRNYTHNFRVISAVLKWDFLYLRETIIANNFMGGNKEKKLLTALLNCDKKIKQRD